MNIMRDTAVVEFLKSIPYFSGLGAAELEAIKRHTFERVAERAELILLDGQPAEAWYFVASGVVKVFKTSAEGKEQTLYLARPGDSLNEVSIFDGGPNPATAQAMGTAVLYGIRSGDAVQILRDYPRVARDAATVLAARVRHLVSLVEDLSFRNVTSRVARILLDHAGDGAGSRPHLTQQEMASLAGTAREMIGRSLKTLEEEGMIRFDRHRIVIINKKALQEIAGLAS